MGYKQLVRSFGGVRVLRFKRVRALQIDVAWCHSSADSHEEVLPPEWYDEAFPKMSKLGYSLRNVDLADGKLVNVRDNLRIYDDSVEQKMRTFKSIVRAFIGSTSVQQMLQKDAMELSSGTKCTPFVFFSKASERQPMVVNSLTKVSSYLNISSQQRKLVRLAICPQVTQERIWTATLERILNELRTDLDYFYDNFPRNDIKMGWQIVSSCINFLSDFVTCYDGDSTSWMRPAPVKAIQSPALRKWDNVLEMFNDLIGSLKNEDMLLDHVKKLEVMKEGLSQIRDVLVDKSIGYKEARHQESLVQKKLTKTLGHSSQCLFTLLLYYLYGRVRDIEVDINGGIYGDASENKFCLCMGRILTSDEEKMVRRGVKQLDRALELFKFVWKTAGMKGHIELRGYLWCVEAKDQILTYRGNTYFLHGIASRSSST